jgi:hypothetical protein
MLLGVNRIAMSCYNRIDAGIQAQYDKENRFPRRKPPITEFPNPYDSDNSEDEAQNSLRRGAWEFHGRQMRERNQEYIRRAEDAQKSRKEAIKKAEEAIKKAEEAIKKVDKAEDPATQASTLGCVLSLAKENPEVRSALRNLTAPATATRRLHFPRGGRSKRRTFRKKSAKKASRRSRARKRK